MTAADTPDALVADLCQRAPDLALRAAAAVARRALPVWEEHHEGDPRPGQALDLVTAWLAGEAPAEAVAAAAQSLLVPPSSTWYTPAIAAGEAARLVAEAVAEPSLARLGRVVERATLALMKNWRWRHGTVALLRASLLRSMTGEQVPSQPGPRWRVEYEESTGGDLYEIEYRRKWWIVDEWTGEAMLLLSGETSGRLSAGSWGDLSSRGVEAVTIEGDEAVVGCAVELQERIALQPREH